MLELPLLVRDSDIGASNGATFHRHNPMTGEVVTRAAAATTT